MPIFISPKISGEEMYMNKRKIQMREHRGSLLERNYKNLQKR